MRLTFAIVVCVGALGLGGAAQASEICKIQRGSRQSWVPGLALGRTATVLESEKKPGQHHAVIKLRIEGEWVPEAGEGQVLTGPEGGMYKLEAPIYERPTPTLILFRGPGGELTRERLVLVPGHEEARPGIGLLPSIGVSLIEFEELKDSEVSESYSSLALTVKLDVTARLPWKRWFLGASAFMNVLSLTRDPSSPTEARFFGANGRLGRIFKFGTRWELAPLVGWYYTTMFVDGNDFGFSHLTGPQIYPSLSYRLKDGSFVAIYFKFSPVFSSDATLGFESRELATGLSWKTPLEDGHAIRVGFDLSTLDLVADPLIEWSVLSATLSGGVSF